MKSPKYIPEISPVVFWDIPLESIDYKKNSDFIICRVFNYGNFQEIADIIICYGKKYVKKLSGKCKLFWENWIIINIFRLIIN